MTEMRHAITLLCMTVGLGSYAWAGDLPLGQQDEIKWLQRVSAAAHKLSYSGTFVYRNGSQSETSRIVHVVSNGNRQEKLAVLDGSPREVIRNNEEVKCYLPESRLLIIEQRSTRRTFPSLLPMSLSGLGQSYLVRPGGNGRVAGYESRIIRLEPRDGLRYGHQFWIEPVSGLLLKADIFDAKGEVLESLAFTELQVGGAVNPDALKSGFAMTSRENPDWQVRQASLRELREDVPWQFKFELPGFRREASMRRSISQSNGEMHEVLHWVFSDGLAAISVFISRQQDKTAPADSGEVQVHGALSVFKRAIDGYQVVVMGDVPPAAIKQFAEGIKVRGK